MNKENMPIVNKVRTQVDDTTDYVGNWFGEIHKKYYGEKMCEVKHFTNSDTRLSLLKTDDKTVAMVIENRTEFNHCEYIFCEQAQPSPLPESVEKAAKKHYPNNPEFQLVFELGSNWQFNKQSAEVERLKKALEEIDELTEGYTAPHTLKVIAIVKEALKEK